MSDYSPFLAFTTEDFAAEPRFINWVKQPDKESDTFWQTFLLLHPEKNTEVEQAKKLIQDIGTYSSSHTLSSEEIGQLRKNIRESISRKPKHLKEKKVNFKPYYRVAAIFLVLVFSIGMVRYLIMRQSSPQDISVQATDGSKKIWLPDSSLAILSAKSTLTYPQNWEGKTIREVSLSGGAYFEIQKDLRHQRKFIVRTEDLRVEVLGTTFNVSARDQKTQVVLKEGSIQLAIPHLRSTPYPMKPGDLISYVSGDSSFNQKEVNAEVYTSWTEGALRFENTAFAEVADLLEQHFHIDIIFQDETLPEKTFNFKVPIEPSKEALLGILVELFDIKLSTSQDTIYINSKY